MDLKLRLVRLFVADGMLRPIWRVLVFFCIGNGVMFALGPVYSYAFARMPSLDRLTIASVIFGESGLLVSALVATGAFGWYERKRVDSYGMPVDRIFSAPFFQGIALGIAGPALAGLGMLALHGWVIKGFNLHGSGWLLFPLGWLIANVVIGISEEAWYRGYMLQTLAKSLGFWPAAIALSLLFTADHYFFKTGENVWDVITLFSLGIFICLTVRRTGTLWLAVGFHIAFDFMQLFVIGTRNGAQLPAGSLFTSAFPGPAWVNGGVLGTEASALMYPIIALMYIYVLVRYPKNVALLDR